MVRSGLAGAGAAALIAGAVAQAEAAGHDPRAFTYLAALGCLQPPSGDVATDIARAAERFRDARGLAGEVAGEALVQEAVAAMAEGWTCEAPPPREKIDLSPDKPSPPPASAGGSGGWTAERVSAERGAWARGIAPDANAPESFTGYFIVAAEIETAPPPADPADGKLTEYLVGKHFIHAGSIVTGQVWSAEPYPERGYHQWKTVYGCAVDRGEPVIFIEPYALTYLGPTWRSEFQALAHDVAALAPRDTAASYDKTWRKGVRGSPAPCGE